MPHRARFPVRFNEVDAAGIVFFPRFYDYFHMTFEGFFGEATGVPYHEWIQQRRVGWPAVHVETDFRAPLRYGMQVEVTLTIPKIGTSSFVCRYEARDPAAGTLLCTCEITVVTSDLDRMASLPIPPIVRQALERAQEP
ncbi:MAG TPA: thioesterase family protein [Vulgatibacter sp.]